MAKLMALGLRTRRCARDGHTSFLYSQNCSAVRALTQSAQALSRGLVPRLLSKFFRTSKFTKYRWTRLDCFALQNMSPPFESSRKVRRHFHEDSSRKKPPRGAFFWRAP